MAPELIVSNTTNQTILELNFIINKLINDEGISTKSLVIVSDSDYSKSILARENYIGKYKITFNDLCDTNPDEVCFKTIDEFKGLESDIVIYLKYKYENLPEAPITRYREYVALTRARYYLYVLSTKSSLNLGG